MLSRIFALVLIALTSAACADDPQLSSEQLGAGSLDFAADADSELTGAALWSRGKQRAAERGKPRAHVCPDPSDASTQEPVPANEEPASCLFGEQFSDLRSHDQLTIVDEHWITVLAQVPTQLEQAQLVAAVRQSSHDDVVSAEEALSRVDQQEIRRMDLHDASGTPLFTVYEYGVGDNSYGAIFVYDTRELAANIHDGDLLNCQF